MKKQYIVLIAFITVCYIIPIDAANLVVYRYQLKGQESTLVNSTGSYDKKHCQTGYFIANMNKSTIETPVFISIKKDKGDYHYIIENSFVNQLYTYSGDTASVLFKGTFNDSYFGDRETIVAGPIKQLELNQNKFPKLLKGATCWHRYFPGETQRCGNGSLVLRYDKKIISRLAASSVNTVDQAIQYIQQELSDKKINSYNPVANSDSHVPSAQETASKTIELSVLANDTDPFGFDFEVYQIKTPSAYGNVTIKDHKTIIYSVDEWSGFTQDSFVYEIINSKGGTDSATVSISLGYPEAVDDSAYTTPDTTVSVDVLANDTDPYESPLTIINITTPDNGKTTLEDNIIFYTPDKDFAGKDSFTYTIQDSYGLTASATVSLFVDQPKAVDDTALTPINTPVIIDVLANDQDSAGLSLSIQSTTTPVYGSVEKQDSKLVYTPKSSYIGQDIFNYTVTNGHSATDSALVIVTTGPNTPACKEDTAYTKVNTPLSVDVLANDTDPQGLELTLTDVDEAQHGTVTIKNNELYYTPESGYEGVDSFWYSVKNSNDVIGFGIVKIHVDLLKAIDDTFYVVKNMKTTLPVMANDIIADNSTATIKEFTDPEHGTLTLGDASSTLFYTPQNDYLGSDTFTYTLTNNHGAESTATVTLEVGDMPAPDEWTAIGSKTDENLGYTVAVNGDVNGDGFNDAIVAAPSWGSTGYVALYSGSVNGLKATADWTYTCSQSGAFPGFVNYAGDVNNDGFDDVIIGIPLYDNGAAIDAGRAILFLGSSSGLKSTPDWTYDYNQESSRFGRSVSGAGDVNGDGFDDVIVGAPWNEQYTGKAFLFYGSESGLSQVPDWTMVNNESESQFGFSVAGADVNNDGFSDALVTAKNYSNGENAEGAAYIYYGSASGLSSSPSWQAESNNTAAEFGYCIRNVGDINNDGYTDIAIGAWLAGYTLASQGAVYIYHGSSSGLSAEADKRLTGSQEGAFMGISCSGGDVNKDGFSDLCVAAPAYSGFTGKGYCYHGSSTGLESEATWQKTGPGYGDFSYGNSIGDVNGDGYADLIISSPYTQVGDAERAGEIFIYYGRFDAL